ncbi:MAG: hypothetical protein AVDCRST_MAG59-1912 [uncultured Thermomicrobiales bacterium]|uniref:Uncharacterized protein n=1 Tax=uncultured Thermomicrobiales bacterium TaxID=1645740 RepID=A0A6J4UND4_9BACT|nr:MAG: hypothetical protein AVDCRST_MAG59-1912 [uncultured Thermomicrobiales bacterium]
MDGVPLAAVAGFAGEGGRPILTKDEVRGTGVQGRG